MSSNQEIGHKALTREGREREKEESFQKSAVLCCWPPEKQADRMWLALSCGLKPQPQNIIWTSIATLFLLSLNQTTQCNWQFPDFTVSHSRLTIWSMGVTIKPVVCVVPPSSFGPSSMAVSSPLKGGRKTDRYGFILPLHVQSST